MYAKLSILTLAIGGISNRLPDPPRRRPRIVEVALSQLPAACRDGCIPIMDLAITENCQADPDACIPKYCTANMVEAVVKCQSCIGKGSPDFTDEDKKAQGEMVKAWNKSCETGMAIGDEPWTGTGTGFLPTTTSTRTPVSGASTSAPAASASSSAPASSGGNASPSATSAASVSETSNAAMMGAKVGSGMMMGALGLVLAAL